MSMKMGDREAIAGPTCATCYFWQRVSHPKGGGQCRRRAPGVYHAFEVDTLPSAHGDMLVQKRVAMPFPLMSAGDWCGEHEPAGDYLPRPVLTTGVDLQLPLPEPGGVPADDAMAMSQRHREFMSRLGR